MKKCRLLGDAATIADQDKFRALSREYAQLSDVARCYTDWRRVQEDIETRADDARRSGNARNGAGRAA
ncbi:hypothetical protein MJ561_18020 [Klebsiella pneumoniae]|nr:hypothetical protein MJ561_18020 [Klebsiella pneumoniae]